ncbi:MAG: hypothetical protein ACTS80_00760 [Candidatus Hodgkinia cicadicola]
MRMKMLRINRNEMRFGYANFGWTPKMLSEWTKKLQKRIRNETYKRRELTLVELRGLISKDLN